ncbi:hypothetical protein [Bacteroides sp.]
MKHIILALLMLAPLTGIAQENETIVSQDTTLYVNGRKIVIKENDNKIKVKLYEQSSQGDTIENDQIFEGIYSDGQTTERRTVFNVPFMKKKTYNKFNPHVAGIYLGYSRMADGFLSFGNPKEVDLRANKSWEIGFTLFDGSLALTRDNAWGLSAGLGWGYTSFRVDGNYAFDKINGITEIVPGLEDDYAYTQSRLRYFYFRIPVTVEWQKKFGRKGPLFFSAGLEAEIRHGVKSKVKYAGQKRNLGNDLNIHPLGINFLAQAGYGDLGVYMRYSTYSLFQKDKGPKLLPYSFGISWYW